MTNDNYALQVLRDTKARMLENMETYKSEGRTTESLESMTHKWIADLDNAIVQLEKVNDIELRSWMHECGEPGCCTEYGVDLIVNGENITDQFEMDMCTDDLKRMLGILKVKYEIKETDEND